MDFSSLMKVIKKWFIPILLIQGNIWERKALTPIWLIKKLKSDTITYNKVEFFEVD